MSNNDILTIAIPTYNRLETLERVLVQLKIQSDQDFEIIVSDDASPNSKVVISMLEKYKVLMPNLRINKNGKNLGFSGNVLKLFELATSRYIWFICDDDDVLPDAVKNVKLTLQKYEPVVAVFNHTWVNSYGVKCSAGPFKDRCHKNLSKIDDYQPIMRTTFLSTLVIEKRCSIDTIYKTNYKDNVFVQITIALLMLSQEFKFCEIAVPVVHRNVGFVYGDFYKFILVDEFKSIFAIEHKLDNKKFVKWKIKQLPTVFLLYLSQKLGLFNYKSIPTPETINYIKKHYGNYRYLICLFRYIKAFTPTICLKLIYFIQLILIHGLTNGVKVYNKNINRAYKDKRNTGFTKYR